MPEEYAEVYRDSEGASRWRIKAAENGDVLADSGQGYAHESDLFRALGRVTGRQPTIVETKGAPLPGPNSIRVVMIRG